MSLASWIEKYYPVSTAEVPESEALDHSIRKWEGLQLHVLEQHGLVKNLNRIIDRKSRESFIVGGDTCALCTFYLGGDCATCPLYAELGLSKCDDDEDSPYSVWAYDDNPEPMIDALKRAKARALAREKESEGDQ